MKVLSIVWYKVLPARYGGQKGIHDFNQELGRHCDLSCLCSKDNITAPGLSYRVLPFLPTGKWQFAGRGAAVVGRSIREQRPDWIIAEHPYYAGPAFLAAQKYGARLAVHAHNIEHQRFKRLGKWWWRWVKDVEKKAFERADLVLFKTEEDLQQACETFLLDRKKCCVVPFILPKVRDADAAGVRELYVKKPDQRLLLFAGSLDYAPNATAVRAICHEIAPRLPGVMKIVVCGSCRDKKLLKLLTTGNQHVYWAGEVVDIDAYYAAADVFINPVATGGGVQTKLLQALAANCNAVCFDTMLAGLSREDCRDKLFTVSMDNWDEFVNQIGTALEKKAETPLSFFQRHAAEHVISEVIDMFNKCKK